MKVEVREALPSDYLTIGHNLRPEDSREAEGLLGIPAFLVVKHTLESAHWSRVYTIDDVPCGMFGVTVEPGATDKALGWAMSTPEIRRIRREFIRKSRPYLGEMFNSGPFNKIHNLADTRNSLHMRWLKWLGATLLGPTIRGSYRYFEIRR